MTRRRLQVLQEWAHSPEESFIRSVRLRALASPHLALAARLSESAGSGSTGARGSSGGGLRGGSHL